MRHLIITILALAPIAVLCQNVGIGTTEPAAALDIVGQGDSVAVLRLQTDRPWVFRQFDSGVNSRLALQSEVNFKNFDILSPDGQTRAASFYVGNTFANVMMVPEVGEVGIGVTDASGKLHISENSTTGFPQLRLTEEQYDFSRIKMDNTAFPGAYWDLAGRATDNADLSLFNFYFNNGITSGDRMTITGAGNVGIGTTSPDAKLEVRGKIIVDDDAHAPQTGAIRWNDETHDFEGYNGSEWLSLTTGKQTTEFPTVDNTGPGNLLGYQRLEWPADRNYSSSIEMSTTHTICGDEDALKAAVYKLVGDAWEYDTELSPSDPGAALDFGASVSTYGDWAAVGAPRGTVSGQQRGKVYIFKKTAGTWAQQAVLTDPNGSSNDNFGRSVSMYGTDLVIGAPNADDNLANQGKVVFFHIEGSNWVYTGEYFSASAAAHEWLGWDVSLSANYCVIGAPIEVGFPGDSKMEVLNRFFFK